ncbi:TetR/AcrR family transcriptional regulator [Trebonia kvetii]|uniref:TetR/AcrR family transcriptional regulator n=2 Tax=Trebonia kvetii TaxID=2480626 RepID=A0A6P2BMP9_9ACTN|nr:TetR/AcrR family transcriptional regulator [Trebonia kvetii]
MEEITATARRLLVEQGPEAASLRAIAREMGMTAPGLYRYYSSREELLRHVIATMFTELSRDIHRAIDEVGLSSGGVAFARGEAAPDEIQRHLALKLVAACREFRRWGLSHKDEFTLLFGVPLPGFDDGRFDVAQECAMEFAGTFYGLFIELWSFTHFPVPAPGAIDKALRAQLGRFRAALGTDVPDGAVLVFLRCWVLLYGAVSMEVFGHLGFALDDPAPMFEFTLADLARLVGLDYPVTGA